MNVIMLFINEINEFLNKINGFSNEIMVFINVLPESIKIGLIYSIMAMGVYITYKILDFPDMTVDGSFPLGGFVYAAVVLTPSISYPFLAMFIAFISGSIAGYITATLNVKFGIDKLLSGILVMIGLYSINARVVGSPSVFIDSNSTIFGNVTFESKIYIYLIYLVVLLFLKGLYDYNIKTNKYVMKSFLIYLTISIILTLYVFYTKDISMMLVVLIVFSIKLVIDYILTSKFGFILRALGDNEVIVTGLGVDSKRVKICGLMLANGLVSLSGAIFTQYMRVIDLSSSVGNMVIGLASIIFGLGILKKSRTINYVSIVITGAVVYYIVINFALNSSSLTNNILEMFNLSQSVIDKFSIRPTDVKLITAILLSVILGIEYKKKKKVK